MAVRWCQRQQRWMLLLALVVAFALFLASFAKNRVRSSLSTSCDAMPRVVHQLQPMLLQRVGWTEAVRQFRVALVNEAVKLKKHSNGTTDNSSDFLADITPFQNVITAGLDTFGVGPMLGEVFTNIEWYFPESWYRPYSLEKEKRCNWHGIGCEYYDVWFIWHYVGAIMAEKLLGEGSLLLDGSTGQRMTSAVEAMNEIHRIQEEPFVTRMSFHAEHGFIWFYLASTTPNLDAYPQKLARKFCSKYDEPFYVPSVNKYIGSECYHGFGHAIYEILAMRQLGIGNGGSSKNYTASSAFRANSGFVLSGEAFCQGYQICKGAPEYPTFARKHCFGGMTHAAWLFSRRGALPNSKREVDQLFQEARDECERKYA